jgi:hypothetical protein
VRGVVWLMGEGRPFVITEDLKDRVDDNVHEDRRFTIVELREYFTYVRNMSSARLSQFNSNTEKLVPNRFQEQSQLNTNRRSE